MSVCPMTRRLSGAGRCSGLALTASLILLPAAAFADPAPLPPAVINATLPGGPANPSAPPSGLTPRFIRVSGSGVVRAKPGEAHIVFLVSSTDPNPVKALDDNTKKVEKVVNELVNRGVQRPNILTSESSLAPASAASSPAAPAETGTPVDIDGGGSDPAGGVSGGSYTANARVDVVTYEISHATQIVQIGMYGGATAVMGMRFAPSDLSHLKSEALILAMKDAADKAGVLAAGIRATILYAISVTETPAAAPEPPGASVAPPAQVAVPVTIEITYAVG